MDLKYEVDQVYTIMEIDPLCDWYQERNLFERKVMKCVEVFPDEDSAGFSFENPMDAPDHYNPGKAYCLLNPMLYPVGSQRRAHLKEKQVPRY